MTSSSWCRPEYRADIQGLRAIAVIAVIIFHADKAILPGGFVGVDLFFVISGFLVGGIVLKKVSEGSFSLIDFYLARIRRIVPAYLAMLGLVTLLTAVLFTPSDFNHYWASAKSSLYFGSNRYFAEFGSYFAPASDEMPLLHTWSLAIEMQFYLILPVLLICIPRKLIKPIIISLILLSVTMSAILIDRGNKQGAYFSLLVRAPEFLIGVLLAAMARSTHWRARINSLGRGRDALSLLGLTLISYSFFAINEESQFPGTLVAYPCIGAALVIAGGGGRVSSYLSTAPLVWVGSLSYSLYLWHWPAFAMVRYVTEKYTFSPPIFIGTSVAVILISYASLRWLEIPFRNNRSSTRLGKLRTSGLLLSIASIFFISPRANAAIEKPLPIEYTRYADPDTICHGRIINDCLKGAQGVLTAPILVLGDSHAAQLNLFFDRVGEQNDERFRVVSASSCVTIPGFDIDRLPVWARKDCQNAIEYASNFLPTSSNVIIAAMWQYQLQSKDFVFALKEFLKQAELSRIQVTLLWQVPMLSANVQRNRRLRTLGISKEILVHEGWHKSNLIISEIASHFSNVRFLTFSNESIFKDPPFYNGELMYGDSHHLNEIGAIMYADIAAKRF